MCTLKSMPEDTCGRRGRKAAWSSEVHGLGECERSVSTVHAQVDAGGHLWQKANTPDFKHQSLFHRVHAGITKEHSCAGGTK